MPFEEDLGGDSKENMSGKTPSLPLILTCLELVIKDRYLVR